MRFKELESFSKALLAKWGWRTLQSSGSNFEVKIFPKHIFSRGSFVQKTLVRMKEYFVWLENY
jgi:hypothetical protein